MTKANALDDVANQSFLDLIMYDKANVIGSVEVDSGHIEVGDCGVQQHTINVGGDGVYNVWRGEKYIIIEADMLNQMLLHQALEENYD